MRLATVPIAILAVALLFAVPVGGAPNLQVGSYATYNLSIKVSFSPSLCQMSTVSGVQTDLIFCPLNETATDLPSIETNGTLGWNATRLDNNIAVLNVTRDLRTFLSSNLTTPVFKSTGSFNESIFLTNRTIGLTPFIMPEVEQSFLMSGGSNAASNWTSSVDSVMSAMWVRHPDYTMWWVNGPLSLNQTVPVLTIPTNVTNHSTIDLGGSVGSRSAWNLTYALPRISPMDDPSLVSAIPVGDNFLASFSFNYDQQSDLLLSASSNIHLGFIEPVQINCVPSANTKCPATSLASTCFTIPSGIDVQANLTLAKTNLNLSQRLGSGGDTSGTGSNSGGTGTGGSNSGSSSSGGSNSGSAGGTNGGSSGGNNGGTNSGSNNGGNSGTNSGGTTGSNSGTNPAPLTSGSKPLASIPWIYWVLGLIAIVAIVASLAVVRRRRKK